MEDELRLIAELPDCRARMCAWLLYGVRDFLRESPIKKPLQGWTAAEIVEAVKTTAPQSWLGVPPIRQPCESIAQSVVTTKHSTALSVSGGTGTAGPPSLKPLQISV